MASQAEVVGPAAAEVVVAVGPAAAAGMVAVAEPGAAVEAPGAAVEVVVIDAATKIVASPPASPTATGVAAAVAGPGSYSTPRFYCLLPFGGRLPHVGSVATAEPP
jgi:hypothetical protein